MTLQRQIRPVQTKDKFVQEAINQACLYERESTVWLIIAKFARGKDKESEKTYQ